MESFSHSHISVRKTVTAGTVTVRRVLAQSGFGIRKLASATKHLLSSLTVFF